MSKKSTNSLEGHLQKKRQWLSKFQNVLRRGLSLLDQDLQAPSRRTLISIADSLGDVATYYGTEGTVQVSDGDTSGWSRIHMAAAFRFWATKIRAKCFTSSAFLAPVSRIPNLTNYSALSACLLCYSTANHLDAWQAETLEILQGIGTWPGAISESYWAERVFEPFVLRLHQRLGHFDMPEVLE